MKIRSITSFFKPSRKTGGSTLSYLESLTQFLKSELEAAGYPVQTTRLATVPFSKLKVKTGDLLPFLIELEESAIQHHFQYLSVGSVDADDQANYDLILPILEQGKQTFVTGQLLTSKSEISLKAIYLCAKIIETAAKITSDGFTNLRFAAIANVAPFCPFFPAGFSKGSRTGFSLALEGADLAVGVFSSAKSLKEARQSLLNEMESHAHKITKICQTAHKKFNVHFHGLDFSLAPYPDDNSSIGKALETLGVSMFGNHGSVAAAAFLASILDTGKWKKVGFNGLMLPVLEDSTLASRSALELQLKDLLLFATVCGTGLDTIPLPGDTSSEIMAPILLDLAALSSRLHKPLTARLMPLPGLGIGDLTKFNFEYFANGKVMQPHSQSLSKLFALDEVFKINTRINK